MFLSKGRRIYTKVFVVVKRRPKDIVGTNQPHHYLINPSSSYPIQVENVSIKERQVEWVRWDRKGTSKKNRSKRLLQNIPTHSVFYMVVDTL